MPAPKAVHDLVEKFTRKLDECKSPSYNETSLRNEFLNPLFEAMQWDILNREGNSEAYKDVIHEDAIKVGDSLKAPDYSFRVGGQRKFFVEAKKPSVNIENDPAPAFQLRRYAWSARLSLSILTDFEEFAVYDTRVRPKEGDKASTARILLVKYTEYEKRWDEIASVFSKDAIFKGSFDKYASGGKKQGTATVDVAFLDQMEKWREKLAKNIYANQNNLSVGELTDAVQKTIDRIIFLRICEGRGIEPAGTSLQTLLNGEKVYPRLCEVFRRADEKYNSGLFHFRKEKERAELPDNFTLTLTLDDKVLKEIISELYYPKSDFEYSILPVEILGQVYEQFLGKVIRLTPQRVVIDEKPEVKKAGGVYYTPRYIVDYIVSNTVGKLLEGKTPKNSGELKILDPACGSGSFLLGAYQYLLDWHLKWYTDNDPKKWASGKNPPLFMGPGGSWRLTATKKKEILLNNLYGVDIDSQAVEVTKLSLLLQVLEGESAESINAQYKMFHDRALPDLSLNIKCGNSLIGWDFFKGHLTVDDEFKTKINPFSWDKEFVDIFKNGGFDAVIGNPPYGALFSDDEKVYIKDNFKAYKYRFDSYIYFIEKAIDLSRNEGYVGFITPELWLKLENCEPLRQLILESTGFELLRICGESVFDNAVVNTIISILRKGIRNKEIRIETGSDVRHLPVKIWKSADNLSLDYRFQTDTHDLVSKIKSVSKPLSDFGVSIQGITPYDKYRGQSAELIKKRAFHFDYQHDSSCGKWLQGKDLSRYEVEWSGEWLKYGNWLAAPREPRFFEKERLLFREVPGKGKRIQASLATETFYHGHSITPFKPINSLGFNIRYLLGLTNSKLISWYAASVLPNFGKDIFPKLNPQDISSLPIRLINISNRNENQIHDNIVKLVDSLLSAPEMIEAAKTTQGKTSVQREIEAADRKIDALVYELYGLTEEEIKIVEGDS